VTKSGTGTWGLERRTWDLGLGDAGMWGRGDSGKWDARTSGLGDAQGLEDMGHRARFLGNL